MVTPQLKPCRGWSCEQLRLPAFKLFRFSCEVTMYRSCQALSCKVAMFVCNICHRLRCVVVYFWNAALARVKSCDVAMFASEILCLRRVVSCQSTAPVAWAQVLTHAFSLCASQFVSYQSRSLYGRHVSTSFSGSCFRAIMKQACRQTLKSWLLNVLLAFVWDCWISAWHVQYFWQSRSANWQRLVQILVAGAVFTACVTLNLQRVSI